MPKHDEHLGHLLWELSARTNALAEAALEPAELTRPSLGMLDIISETPGIAIAEIARRTPKTQQAVSQVVARLESLGLIERRLVGARTIGLYLTASGARARSDGAAAEAAFEKKLEAAFGRDKYERLRKVLLDARPVLVELGDARAKSEVSRVGADRASTATRPAQRSKGARASGRR